MTEEAPWEEDTHSYPRLQISGFANGDQTVVRAGDANELAKLVSGLAENSEEIVKGWTTFKQAHVAFGAFTGNSDKQRSSQRSTSTATDSAPPAATTGGIPSCKHGPMKDLSGRGYRNRWYCPQPQNATDKCKALP